ncbi:hypothetical protein [Synechococcus phage Ssp-JY38]|jgi:hypothetical protein|nr:hypothetical protein [Synechococcus phage Yong-L2-223]
MATIAGKTVASNDIAAIDAVVALFNAGKINADQMRQAVDVIIANAR